MACHKICKEPEKKNFAIIINMETRKDIPSFLFKGVKDKERMTRKELGVVLRRAHLLNLNVYGIDVEDRRGNVVDVLYWMGEDKYWYLNALEEIEKSGFFKDKVFSITYGTDEDYEKLQKEVEREIEEDIEI